MVVVSDGRLAGRRMLVADDDPAILSIIAGRCAKMGFDVETAINGIQLLIKARQNRPDIVIVDVNMPELDGLSVCTRLMESGTRPVNVVVVTGSSDPNIQARCENLGMFYGRKGQNFWKTIESVLSDIYPDLSFKMEETKVRPVAAKLLERPRVLLVDDDPAIELFLSSRLGKYGVDTLYAQRAVQGLRIACRERPSAVVCDYSMPDGDAQYFLSRLRSASATANMPVIVLSGQQLDGLTEQRLTQEILGHPGAALIVKKSFDTDELFVALQRFCAFNRS